MSNATEFFESIGLTSGIRIWLRRNEGDPLREAIISELMTAIDNDFIPEQRAILRLLIGKVANNQTN